MKQIRSWAAAHRKAILGAVLAGAGGILTYQVGADSVWVTVIVPIVAVALGVNYIPNRREPEPPPVHPPV